MKPTRIKTVVLTGLLAALPAFFTGCPFTSEVVIFPDESLEVAVRSALRQPLGFITVADMRDLIELDAHDFGVTDLRGLEHAVNLQILNVSNSAPTALSITSISPLATLVNLRILNLANNNILDITPVSGLFNLDQLILAGNFVFNITPLVANSGAGGLGPGDTVTLEGAALFDADGVTGPQVLEDIGFLLDQGVDVLFAGVDPLATEV